MRIKSNCDGASPRKSKATSPGTKGLKRVTNPFPEGRSGAVGEVRVPVGSQATAVLKADSPGGQDEVSKSASSALGQPHLPVQKGRSVLGGAQVD